MDEDPVALEGGTATTHGVAFENYRSEKVKFPVGLSLTSAGDSHGTWSFGSLEHYQYPVKINDGGVEDIDDGYCENKLCFNIKYYILTTVTIVLTVAIFGGICYWCFCKGGCSKTVKIAAELHEESRRLEREAREKRKLDYYDP